MRILKLLLVFDLGWSAGCGTYCSHLFELAPIDTPYAGTKHDCGCLADMFTEDFGKLVVRIEPESPIANNMRLYFYRSFCVSFCLVDIPLSFAADTLFLPVQASISLQKKLDLLVPSEVKDNIGYSR